MCMYVEWGGELQGVKSKESTCKQVVEKSQFQLLVLNTLN